MLGTHLRAEDWACGAARGPPRCAGRAPGGVRARRSDSVKDTTDHCHSRPVHKHPLQGRPPSIGALWFTLLSSLVPMRSHCTDQLDPEMCKVQASAVGLRWID